MFGKSSEKEKSDRKRHKNGDGGISAPVVSDHDHIVEDNGDDDYDDDNDDSEYGEDADNGDMFQSNDNSNNTTNGSKNSKSKRNNRDSDDSDSDVSDGGRGYGKKHGKRKKSKAEREKVRQEREKQEQAQTSISASSFAKAAAATATATAAGGGGANSNSASSANIGRSFEKVFWRGAPGEDPPSEELKRRRQEIGVNVKGNFLACPFPTATIKDEGLPESFQKMFQTYNLSRPTPIQQQCWPALLSGANVLGISPTGSGKTIAFGLPIIPHACAQLKLVKVKQGETSHPIALVLTPTRELAIQVAKVFKHFKRSTGLNTVAIYGGDAKAKQIDELMEGTGAHIIAGTPGRLLDLVSHKNLFLDNVTYLVIDEADRMLALGFQDQIGIISDNIRPDRQTALFSATFPGKLRDLTMKWVKDAVIIRCSTLEMKMPVFDKDNNVIGNKLEKNNNNESVAKKESAKINTNSDDSANSKSSTSMSIDGASLTAKLVPPPIVKNDDDSAEADPDYLNSSTLTISKTIEQHVHVCASHKKPRLLIRYITKIREQEIAEKARQPGAMMIFCTKIKTLSFVMDFLKRHNVKGVHMLHGNMPQSQREQVLNDFRAGKIHSICSTDVAARGIHIKRLKYVFNYDFPTNLEQYCHRVGRTGRQGEKGESYSLITRNLAPMASGIIDLLKSCGQVLEPNLLALAEDYKIGNWVYDEQEEKHDNNISKEFIDAKEDLIETSDEIQAKLPIVSKGSTADSFLDDT